MTHTNVQIPTSSDTRDREAFHRITGELTFWRKEAERLADELRNIPKAVERYGYITFPAGSEEIKLVRASEASDETERFRAALTAIADGEGDADVIARQTLDGLDRE